MHCPICDRDDPLISFDKTTGKFGDCTSCQATIAECLSEFGDEEDDDIES